MVIVTYDFLVQLSDGLLSHLHVQRQFRVVLKVLLLHYTTLSEEQHNPLFCSSVTVGPMISFLVLCLQFLIVLCLLLELELVLTGLFLQLLVLFLELVILLGHFPGAFRFLELLDLFLETLYLFLLLILLLLLLLPLQLIQLPAKVLLLFLYFGIDRAAIGGIGVEKAIGVVNAEGIINTSSLSSLGFVFAELLLV